MNFSAEGNVLKYIWCSSNASLSGMFLNIFPGCEVRQENLFLSYMSVKVIWIKENITIKNVIYSHDILTVLGCQFKQKKVFISPSEQTFSLSGKWRIRSFTKMSRFGKTKVLSLNDVPKDRQEWNWADWISSVFDKILNYGLFVLSLNITLKWVL